MCIAGYCLELVCILLSSDMFSNIIDKYLISPGYISQISLIKGCLHVVAGGLLINQLLPCPCNKYTFTGESYNNLGQHFFSMYFISKTTFHYDKEFTN